MSNPYEHNYDTQGVEGGVKKEREQGLGGNKASMFEIFEEEKGDRTPEERLSSIKRALEEDEALRSEENLDLEEYKAAWKGFNEALASGDAYEANLFLKDIKTTFTYLKLVTEAPKEVKQRFFGRFIKQFEQSTAKEEFLEDVMKDFDEDPEILIEKTKLAYVLFHSKKPEIYFSKLEDAFLNDSKLSLIMDEYFPGKRAAELEKRQSEGHSKAS